MGYLPMVYAYVGHRQIYVTDEFLRMLFGKYPDSRTLKNRGVFQVLSCLCKFIFTPHALLMSPNCTKFSTSGCDFPTGRNK